MIYLLLFVIGACIGSFLGVCVDRIPKNESIIFGRSHCTCGKKIPFYLNIPILAWIILKGRAKCCGAKIPVRFLLIEILSGALLPLLWLIEKNITETAIYSTLIFSLLVAAFIDFDTLLIPDKLSITLALIGISVSIFFPQIHNTQNLFLSLTRSLIGLLAGSGLLFWIGIIGEQIFKKEAIGLGDVQLIGAIGTFCGFQGCLAAIFGGSLIGTLIILPIIIWKYLTKSEQLTIVPFVPFLTLGTIAYVMFKDFIVW